MKGFIITVGLIVTAIIVGITQIDNIGQSFRENAVEIEGGEAKKAEFDKLKTDSPELFRDRYQKAFDTRILICKFTYFLGGDATFKQVGEETRELYLGTLYDKEDEFAAMMHRLSKLYEDRQPQLYYARLLEIAEHCPKSAVMDDVARETKLIKIRLNIS